MGEAKADHWQNVYQSRSPGALSWFRPHLDVSLELLNLAGLNEKSRVIDIGAGASTLVDDLLDRGVRDIAAFDLSQASLDIAKRRLGARAQKVRWIVGDAARHTFERDAFDIWHDRAALHFLVDPDDASAYAANAACAVASGGHAIIGCFAADGPERCSGLPVTRRDPEDIQALFQRNFTLITSRREQHITPSGVSQPFAYALLKKTG
jgi:SAM-dependent methyltransferase